MSDPDNQLQAHFEDFLVFVGPATHQSRRDEYAQYCRGMVDAAVIGGLINPDRAREMAARIHKARRAA